MKRLLMLQLSLALGGIGLSGTAQAMSSSNKLRISLTSSFSETIDPQQPQEQAELLFGKISGASFISLTTKLSNLISNNLADCTTPNSQHLTVFARMFIHMVLEKAQELVNKLTPDDLKTSEVDYNVVIKSLRETFKLEPFVKVLALYIQRHQATLSSEVGAEKNKLFKSFIICTLCGNGPFGLFMHSKAIAKLLKAANDEYTTLTDALSEYQDFCLKQPLAIQATSPKVPVSSPTQQGQKGHTLPQVSTHKPTPPISLPKASVNAGVQVHPLLRPPTYPSRELSTPRPMPMGTNPSINPALLHKPSAPSLVTTHQPTLSQPTKAALLLQQSIQAVANTTKRPADTQLVSEQPKVAKTVATPQEEQQFNAQLVAYTAQKQLKNKQAALCNTISTALAGIKPLLPVSNYSAQLQKQSLEQLELVRKAVDVLVADHNSGDQLRKSTAAHVVDILSQDKLFKIDAATQTAFFEALAEAVNGENSLALPSIKDAVDLFLC